MLAEPWTITLFGGLSAQQAERVVTRFQTQKTAALLAYLAYYAHRDHPREELIALLWPDAEPEAGRMSLRTALSSLRRQLEPPGVRDGSVLIADRVNVRLNVGSLRVDAMQFEQALRAASRLASEEQVEPLSQAIELYRGELLPGFYEEWVLSERGRQADIYLGALRQLTKLLAQAKEFQRALEIARRAVSADPLREESHRNLIRLYVAVGRPAAALQQYEEMERLLRDSLGMAPSQAARTLLQELQAYIPGGLRERATASAPQPALNGHDDAVSTDPAATPSPTPATISITTPRLPLQLNRFFGREAELERMTDLLRPGVSANRLVTLTGPGGTGKTRLSIEVAGRLQEAYNGAVWFVPLADLSDGRLVATAIAEALRLEASATDPLEQAIAFLSAQPALLILDNFEQIAEIGAATVRGMLARLPSLTCLVTSRLPLGLSGEQEIALAPLPSPDDKESPDKLISWASVALFVDRAQAYRPDFQVTRGNAAAIAALCARLEGIPLAIELAAAWIQILTPAQMLERLSRRFSLLVSRRKDTEERHRTLRDAIAWSYRMLSPDQARFFARLSAFRGGWTVEAAESVCRLAADKSASGFPLEEGFALDYLMHLRAHSLVLAEEVAGEMRFRMLETLREFASEQVPEAERAELARRHALVYLALAEEISARLGGMEDAFWLDRLETEHDNFRTALDWCLTDPASAETGVRLVAALTRFWTARGYLREGLERAETLLSLEGAQAHTRALAKALNGAGVLAINLSDGDSAKRYYQESLAIFRELDDKSGMGRVLSNLGFIAQEYSDFEQAHRMFEECLALFHEIDDKEGIAQGLSRLGALAILQQDIEQAQKLYEEAFSIHKSRGDMGKIMAMLARLGNVASAREDYVTATALYCESLQMARQMDDKPEKIVILLNLAGIGRKQGQYAEAETYLAEGLQLAWELGDSHMVFRALELAILLAERQGQWERAARLIGALKDRSKTIVGPSEAEHSTQRDQAAETVRAALGTSTYNAVFATGQAMTDAQTVTYALQLPPSPLSKSLDGKVVPRACGRE